MTIKSVLAWLGAALITIPGLMVAGFFVIPLLTSGQNKVSEVSVPATVTPAMKREPRIGVTVRQPVKVYGPSAAAKLKLPADVGPSESVIAATQVRGSDRPQTITTTINTETGESRSFVKQDEFPWLAWEPRGEARLAVGYKIERGIPKQVVRLGVNYDLVRVRAFTMGVSGTIDSDGAAFAGASLAYRW